MSDLLAKDLSIWLHDSVPVKPEAIFFWGFIQISLKPLHY